MGGVRTDTSYPGTAHDQQFITQLVAAGRTPADAERRASRRQVFVPLGKPSQHRVLEAIWGVGGMSDTGGTEFDGWTVVLMLGGDVIFWSSLGRRFKLRRKMRMGWNEEGEEGKEGDEQQ